MTEAPIILGDHSTTLASLLSRFALISWVKGQKMYVKRLIPSIVTLLAMFFTASAFADTMNIDSSFTGDGSTAAGGTWSWAGGSSVLGATFDNSASLNSNPISYEQVTVITGPGTGGSGTMGDPFTFGPSAAGSVSVGGCAVVNSTTVCSGGPLFTGSFQVGELAYSGSGPSVDLTGVEVVGTLSSTLAAALGVNPTVTGSLSALLFGSISASGGSGFTGSGDLGLTATVQPGPTSTPEPSELFLIGTGLFALATYLRTKHRG